MSFQAKYWFAQLELPISRVELKFDSRSLESNFGRVDLK